MNKERKEVAERKTRLQEIFDETRALQGDYSPFNPAHADEAHRAAQEDARDVVVKAFRQFHQRHTGRMRRVDLIKLFVEAASNMS
jgi:5'-deoxynucleotidase YfbR-like HD superfamily hydrolase